MKINCYTCPNGHVTKTQLRDVGVTPMFYECPVCRRMAVSSGFKDIAPEKRPTVEWYRPKNTEKLNWHEVDHVMRGGLLARKIKRKF